MSDVAETTEEAPEPAKKSKSGLFTLIKAGVFVAVIVVVECVGASMFLPSAEETALAAKKIAAAKSGLLEDDAELEDDATDAPNEDLMEVNLGTFYITSYQAESNSTLRIEFNLFATVLAEEESDFQDLFAQNQHRLSEQVHVSFRSAEINDLTDAALGFIKRDILSKCNRTLGKPLLQEIVFSQYRFSEQ